MREKGNYHRDLLLLIYTYNSVSMHGSDNGPSYDIIQSVDHFRRKPCMTQNCGIITAERRRISRVVITIDAHQEEWEEEWEEDTRFRSDQR